MLEKDPLTGLSSRRKYTVITFAEFSVIRIPRIYGRFKAKWVRIFNLLVRRGDKIIDKDASMEKEGSRSKGRGNGMREFQRR